MANNSNGKVVTPAQKKNAFEVAQTLVAMRNRDGKLPKQIEIAQELNINAARVSERLKHAHNEGILELIVSPPEGIGPDAHALAALETELTKKLSDFSPPLRDAKGKVVRSRKLLKVHIVPGTTGSVMKSQKTYVRNEFNSVNARVCNKAAAVYYETIVKENGKVSRKANLHVGISWNRTCEKTINLMKIIKVPLQNVIVCPLVGMIGHKDLMVDSSYLAHRLASRLAASSTKLAFPAICPDKMNPEEMPSISRAMEEIKLCKVGFSGIAPAYFKIRGAVKSALLKRKTISVDDLQKVKEAGAVAEICSHFLDGNAKPISSKRLGFKAVGIKFEQMEQMPRFIVTISPDIEKILPAIIAVRSGIASELVIDHQVAHYILADENNTKLGLTEENKIPGK